MRPALMFIDEALCFGCGMCAQIAPVFRLRSNRAGPDDATLDAMAACPAGAIRWLEEPGSARGQPEKKEGVDFMESVMEKVMEDGATSENAKLYVEDVKELIGEIRPNSIVSRTVFKDRRVKVVLFGFAAGQELSEHTSSKAAILEIVSGRALLTLGDETAHAGPGSWAYLEPGLPHSVAAESEVVMLLTLLVAAQ